MCQQRQAVAAVMATYHGAMAGGGLQGKGRGQSVQCESKDCQCSEGCEATFWNFIEDVSHVGDSGQYGQCGILYQSLLSRLKELSINICVEVLHR